MALQSKMLMKHDQVNSKNVDRKMSFGNCPPPQDLILEVFVCLHAIYVTNSLILIFFSLCLYPLSHQLYRDDKMTSLHIFYQSCCQCQVEAWFLILEMYSSVVYEQQLTYMEISFISSLYNVHFHIFALTYI